MPLKVEHSGFPRRLFRQASSDKTNSEAAKPRYLYPSICKVLLLLTLGCHRSASAIQLLH